MGAVIAETLPLALVITASPFTIIPAIFILFTPRPRESGVAFLVGWLIGIAVSVTACAVAASMIGPRDEGPAWAPWARLVVGVLLVLYAAHHWHTRGRRGTARWMRFLENAGPPKALRLGALMTMLNPKILAFSAAAGIAIGSAPLDTGNRIATIGAFTVLASLTVILPPLLHSIFGNQVLVPLNRAKEWLEVHNSAMVALILLAIGIALAAEGAIQLRG